MAVSAYVQTYRELEVIGRGSYGVAVLVLHLAEEAKYVAKKILLSGLSEKELQGSQQEAQLLRSLDHPNIVKYKESFLNPQELIIVMEYCEVGDLSLQMKKMKKEGTIFTENEIMNWLVQMCMGLRYVHEKRILHRDIKTSNIYLTSNNNVKLGDFGISKLLDSTNDAANTVVGTPYYLSPEVCEGRAYSYKSDVWSLGCVLYELCTFKHAFNADNLLGIVFKIVSGRADPIPARYSMQLKDLIQRMLLKDVNSRPNAGQVLNDPYVQSFMSSFVETRGTSLLSTRTLTYRRTNTYQIEKESESTAAQRQLSRQPEPPQPRDLAELSLSSSGSTIASVQFSSQSPYQAAAAHRFNSPSVDDRPIVSSGKYDLSIVETQLEDIDTTEDVVPQNSTEMNKQLEAYRYQLGADPRGRLEDIKEASNESGSFDKPILAKDQQRKIARLRKTCSDMFGEEKFQEVYRTLRRIKESREDDHAVRPRQRLEALMKSYGKQYSKLFYSVEELLYTEIGR